jgi:dihydrofolate reductase
MRKVIVSTMMSLDGVKENPHHWSFDFWSDEIAQYAYAQLFATDALVMGRLTYEGFAEAWSARAGADEFADRINNMPKYVASRTAQAPLTWNATLIEGDAATAVAQLKQQPGLDILQYGYGELTHSLLQQGLVDELRLLVYPVVVGSGGRIFEKLDKTPLKLLESRSFATGVVALHYQPIQ